MMMTSACSGSGHVMAPAIKPCAHLCGRTINLGRKSSFGIAPDGRLICPKCWQQVMRELDKEAAANV